MPVVQEYFTGKMLQPTWTQDFVNDVDRGPIMRQCELMILNAVFVEKLANSIDSQQIAQPTTKVNIAEFRCRSHLSFD
jgi:hypothetical protein